MFFSSTCLSSSDCSPFLPSPSLPFPSVNFLARTRCSYSNPRERSGQVRRCKGPGHTGQETIRPPACLVGDSRMANTDMRVGADPRGLAMCLSLNLRLRRQTTFRYVSRMVEKLRELLGAGLWPSIQLSPRLRPRPEPRARSSQDPSQGRAASRMHCFAPSAALVLKPRFSGCQTSDRFSEICVSNEVQQRDLTE